MRVVTKMAVLGIALSLSGCGTLTYGVESVGRHLKAPWYPWFDIDDPPFYCGVRADLNSLKKTAAASGSCEDLVEGFLEGLLVVADVPLSAAVDTVLLPAVTTVYLCSLYQVQEKERLRAAQEAGTDRPTVEPTK